MIPDEIKQVQAHLAANPARLVSGGDTRGDSAASEGAVISTVQNHQWDFPVHSPNIGKSHNRAWYDLKIGDYFCDIKISALNGADNTNAKMAIFYLLTGRYKHDSKGFTVPTQEARFFKLMSENEAPDEARDYYYIVVNKNDPSDVFIVNLKGFQTIQSSANNHPFQCSWDKNRHPIERSWQEAKDFLLSHWAKSIESKIKALKSMRSHYPEYYRRQGAGGKGAPRNEN